VLAGAVALLAIFALAAPAGAAASRAATPGSTPPVPANYTLTSHYRGDINSVRGWSITWQVPEVTNPDTAQGAIGQWFYNLETGIYYLPWEGWWVYYYGDQNGADDMPSDCRLVWDTVGGGCFFNVPHAGSQVTFTYEYCDASHAFAVNGGFICAYVDLHDGSGNHFLTRDTRGTTEMYAHDIESFGQPGDSVEPRFSCANPTRMLQQSIKWGTGPYLAQNGVQWDLDVAADVNALYDFQNINFSASPARWESCTPPVSTVCVPAHTYWDPATVYATPTTVAWNRRVYQSRWYTQGEVPGTGSAWQDLGSC
jgi:hypothetical protein